MIVNPQFFNYRLIIGTLVIAIVVLGSYSFSSYNTLKSHDQFVAKEVRLVQNELSDMITFYDDVRVENKELTLQLQQSKSRMVGLLDSLQVVKSDFPLISKYKIELAKLKEERLQLFSKINAIQNQNNTLKKEAIATSKTLQSQQNKLVSLSEENSKLSAIVNKITALSVNQIDVKAIITNTSSIDMETFKAREADNMEVCFTVLKNEYSAGGNKDIYVQILDPNNNVVSDRGSIEFGDTSLIYSGKTSVNYRNNDLDVCTKISVNQKTRLRKGDYTVSVFHDDLMLGSTQITLN